MKNPTGFCGHRNLTFLDLTETAIKNDGVKRLLENNRKLTSIDLSHCFNLKTGIFKIVGTIDLLSLSLKRVNLNEADVMDIGRMSRLTSLTLENLSDEGINSEMIKYFPKSLTHLDIQLPKYCTNGLEALSNLINLTSLRILFTLSIYFPNNGVTVINGNSKSKFNILETLSTLPKLSHLTTEDFIERKLLDNFMIHLEKMGQLRYFQSSYKRSMKEWDVNDYKRMVERFPQFKLDFNIKLPTFTMIRRIEPLVVSILPPVQPAEAVDSLDT